MHWARVKAGAWEIWLITTRIISFLLSIGAVPNYINYSVVMLIKLVVSFLNYLINSENTQYQCANSLILNSFSSAFPDFEHLCQIWICYNLCLNSWSRVERLYYSAMWYLSVRSVRSCPLLLAHQLSDLLHLAHSFHVCAIFTLITECNQWSIWCLICFYTNYFVPFL